MVGVEDAGFRSAQDSRQTEDLKEAKARQGVKGKVLPGAGQGSVGRPSHFKGPSKIGKALGKGEALRIGATPTKAGVELKNSRGEIRSGH